MSCQQACTLVTQPVQEGARVAPGVEEVEAGVHLGVDDPHEDKAAVGLQPGYRQPLQVLIRQLVVHERHACVIRLLSAVSLQLGHRLGVQSSEQAAAKAGTSGGLDVGEEPGRVHHDGVKVVGLLDQGVPVEANHVPVDGDAVRRRSPLRCWLHMPGEQAPVQALVALRGVQGVHGVSFQHSAIATGRPAGLAGSFLLSSCVLCSTRGKARSGSLWKWCVSMAPCSAVASSRRLPRPCLSSSWLSPEALAAICSDVSWPGTVDTVSRSRPSGSMVCAMVAAMLVCSGLSSTG